MNRAYVTFLAVAAIFALILCVNYVQMQYNSVMDSVNLDEIREKAMNELGMVYATSDQVIEYESPSGDYVKQYEGIPEDGVLAQSDKNAK